MSASGPSGPLVYYLCQFGQNVAIGEEDVKTRLL